MGLTLLPPPWLQYLIFLFLFLYGLYYTLTLLSLNYYKETKLRLQNWNKFKNLLSNVNTLDYDLQRCLCLSELDDDIKDKLLNYNLKYLEHQIQLLLSELELGFNILDNKEKEIIYLTYVEQLNHNEIIQNLYMDRSTYFRIRKTAIEKMSKLIISY